MDIKFKKYWVPPEDHDFLEFYNGIFSPYIDEDRILIFNYDDTIKIAIDPYAFMYWFLLQDLADEFIKYSWRNGKSVPVSHRLKDDIF